MLALERRWLDWLRRRWFWQDPFRPQEAPVTSVGLTIVVALDHVLTLITTKVLNYTTLCPTFGVWILDANALTWVQKREGVPLKVIRFGILLVSQLVNFPKTLFHFVAC
jgi:hypothetical protein